MRLIDADKLKDWSEIVPLTGDGGIDINDFDEKLKSMPTVEAIPVEWLKDQIEIASSNGEDDYANALDWTVMKWQTEVEDGQDD